MYSERIHQLMMHRCITLLVFLAAVSAPVLAQLDLQGSWRPLPRNQDGSGLVGDIAGVPVTEGDRLRVQSWSPEDSDITEWSCRPHAWDYSLEGPRFTDKDGMTQSCTLEWGSASLLPNSQVTRTTLRPGDRVVSGQAGRDPSSHRMFITDIKRPSDGREWKGQAR